MKQYIVGFVIGISLITSFFTTYFFYLGMQSAVLNQMQIPLTKEPEFKSDINFQVGEAFEFDVKWKAFRIGSARLEYVGIESIDNDPYFVLKWTIDTLKIKDDERIYGSLKDYLPHKIEREVTMLSGKKKILESYNQEEGKVTIIERSKESAKTSDLHAGGKVDNAILLLYKIRANKNQWKSKDILRVNLPTKQFDLTYDGTKKLKWQGSSEEAHYFYGENNKLQIYLAKNDQMTPLRFKHTIGFSSVDLILKKEYLPKKAKVSYI